MKARTIRTISIRFINSGLSGNVPENELDHFSCWSVRENTREFARVVIRPDQQHKGLSVYLVEGVIRELQSQGAAAIHPAVAKENIPALKLYQKTGFIFCVEADMYGYSYFLCERILTNGLDEIEMHLTGTFPQVTG